MENHSKVGNNGTMGLHGALRLKMSTPWLKLIICPTFITKPIFPIRLLKNSLSFVETLKFKTLKKLKKLKTEGDLDMFIWLDHNS